MDSDALEIKIAELEGRLMEKQAIIDVLLAKLSPNGGTLIPQEPYIPPGRHGPLGVTHIGITGGALGPYAISTSSPISISTSSSVGGWYVSGAQYTTTNAPYWTTGSALEFHVTHTT